MKPASISVNTESVFWSKCCLHRADCLAIKLAPLIKKILPSRKRIRFCNTCRAAKRMMIWRMDSSAGRLLKYGGLYEAASSSTVANEWHLEKLQE